jgi:hypothetical protein
MCGLILTRIFVESLLISSISIMRARFSRVGPFVTFIKQLVVTARTLAELN